MSEVGHLDRVGSNITGDGDAVRVREPPLVVGWVPGSVTRDIPSINRFQCHGYEALET